MEERAAGVNASNSMRLDTAKSNVKMMITVFDNVFDEGGTLRTMKGKPMVIHLKEDIPIIPIHVFSPRRIAYAFQKVAKEKLDKDERKGIIEKVTGATDWCSAMSFVKKPTGKMRSVVDLVHLNKFVKHPRHSFPSPRDIVVLIEKDARCYLVGIDRYSGFPMVQLLKLLDTKAIITILEDWFLEHGKPVSICSDGGP